jgi:hypothetical protein
VGRDRRIQVIARQAEETLGEASPEAFPAAVVDEVVGL